MDVYCEPWTPFCLSSGEPSGVYLLLALHDEDEDLSCKVPLEGADSIELRMTGCDAACDELLGSLIGAQPADSNDVQGTVGAAVAAADLSPIEYERRHAVNSDAHQPAAVLAAVKDKPSGRPRSGAVLDRRCARRPHHRAGRDGRMAPPAAEQKNDTKQEGKMSSDQIP